MIRSRYHCWLKGSQGLELTFSHPELLSILPAQRRSCAKTTISMMSKDYVLESAETAWDIDEIAQGFRCGFSPALCTSLDSTTTLKRKAFRLEEAGSYFQCSYVSFLTHVQTFSRFLLC